MGTQNAKHHTRARMTLFQLERLFLLLTDTKVDQRITVKCSVVISISYNLFGWYVHDCMANSVQWVGR